MRPPRTLIVFHVAGACGAARSLEGRAAWLAESGGLDIAVPGPGWVAETYESLGTVHQLAYEALTVPRGPLQAAGLARRLARERATLRRLIRGTGAELVLVVTAMLPAALAAARAEGVPAILHAAELLTSGRSRGRELAGGALVRMAGALATSVVACSPAVARQYRHAREVATVEPPISDRWALGDADSFRSRHGIEEGGPLLVCVGSVSEGRGQEVAIRALRAVRARFASARLAIVGEPFPRSADLEYAEHLRRAAAAEVGSPAVVFAGFDDRVADAYAAADVVVNPAINPESFGRVACEALAAGRPVVSSAVGAVAETLRDGRTALLVPPGDPDALAAAAISLLSDPDLAERLARAGREDVLRRFDPERGLERFKAAVEAGRAAPESR